MRFQYEGLFLQRLTFFAFSRDICGTNVAFMHHGVI